MNTQVLYLYGISDTCWPGWSSAGHQRELVPLEIGKKGHDGFGHFGRWRQRPSESAVNFLVRNCFGAFLQQINQIHLYSTLIPLVRESIAYPYMDFQNPRISTWISMIFGRQCLIIPASMHTGVHIDIQSKISMSGHSAMDICKNNYPWMDIHVFMDISLYLSLLLWISIWKSMHFYWYPYDLLRIFDPGKSLALRDG